MRNQDEHEERILRKFFATLGVDEARFVFERTGPQGSRPDFKLTFRDHRRVVGVELTALTTQGDERTPRVMSPLADRFQERLREAVAKDPTLSAKFEGKGLVLELAGLPSERQIEGLTPRVIGWLQDVPAIPGSRHSPQEADVRGLVSAAHVIEGLCRAPSVALSLGGPSELPSVLERLREKKKIAQAPDFVRFDETWLMMHGVMASVCARTDALRPEVLREATDCVASRIFDRIYLFDTGKKEVWRFGWEIVPEL